MSLIKRLLVEGARACLLSSFYLNNSGGGSNTGCGANEYLINDEMGNESEVKCRIFVFHIEA